MSSANSFRNFIIDSFGSFSISDNDAVRWETANLLIRKLGGTAVNIGAIEMESSTPTWLLSSMSASWLEQYVSEKLFEIDPFIPHLKNTDAPYVLDTENVDAGQPLNEKLLAAGYHFLYGLPFSSDRASERKIVTYCSDISFEELQKDDQLERIRMLAAILVTQISAPGTEGTSGNVFFDVNPLSEREKEALVWLANGNQNVRIAEKMGISEIMVRKHLISARKKLGVITREQALGVAVHRNLIRI